MGTNYYLYTNNVCPHCGRGDDRFHIGKSSGGWCFALHVDDEFRSLNDWIRAMAAPGAVIKDEYGDMIPLDRMMTIILDRKWPLRAHERPSDFFAQNSAVEGPNNLVRHKIDGTYCVGHGDGTYDLIRGEFS